VVAVFFMLLSFQSTDLQVAMNAIMQSVSTGDREAYQDLVSRFFVQCEAALEQ
ncbi:pkd2, partial [Symbiodinium pilosum]